MRLVPLLILLTFGLVGCGLAQTQGSGGPALGPSGQAPTLATLWLKSKEDVIKVLGKPTFSDGPNMVQSINGSRSYSVLSLHWRKLWGTRRASLYFVDGHLCGLEACFAHPPSADTLKTILGTSRAPTISSNSEARQGMIEGTARAVSIDPADQKLFPGTRRMWIGTDVLNRNELTTIQSALGMDGETPEAKEFLDHQPGETVFTFSREPNS